MSYGISHADLMYGELEALHEKLYHSESLDAHSALPLILNLLNEVIELKKRVRELERRSPTLVGYCSYQHGELLIDREDKSDSAYKWFPVGAIEKAENG